MAIWITTLRRATRASALLLGCALAVATARADPPSLVGRVSWLAGPVTLQAGASSTTEAAEINRPLTRGDALATGSTGRAEVWIGSTALRLDVDSRVVFDRLDDAGIALRLDAGSLALRVASEQAAKGTTIDTPLGRFAPAVPGSFRLDRHGEAIAASAWQGQFGWRSGDHAMTVRSGQRVVVRAHAGGGFDLETGALVDDDFARVVGHRDAAYGGRVAARYVSPEMTGIESLDGHGQWSQVAEYGPVWWPDVDARWAPYRDGRWVSIAPWGWTWIDAAAWGFAPFHYGRWLQRQGRWGWVPGGYVARPVYAPALVGWVGAPGPQAEWFPLAPREPYVPRFEATFDYERRVNLGHAALPALPRGRR